MNTILIKTDGTASIQTIEEPVYMTAGKYFRGMPEVVRPRRLQSPFCMLIDDNGMAHGLMMNLAGSYFYETDMHGCPILGDVYLLKQVTESDGSFDITGLDEQDLETVLELLSDELGCIPEDEREI